MSLEQNAAGITEVVIALLRLPSEVLRYSHSDRGRTREKMIKIRLAEVLLHHDPKASLQPPPNTEISGFPGDSDQKDQEERINNHVDTTMAEERNKANGQNKN